MSEAAVRRYFLFLLLSIVVGTSGCGRSESESLTFWAFGREADGAAVLIDAFERLHPNRKVKLTRIPWSVAHEKLVTAFASDGLPDVMQLGNTWISEFVALHAVFPSSQRFADGDFLKGAQEACLIDGVSWAIPWYVDTRVLFYRKDILAEIGLEGPPATWSAWIAVAQELGRQSGGKRCGLFIPFDDGQWPIILGLQHGSALLDPQRLRSTFDQPEFRTAFDLYLALFRQPCEAQEASSQIGNVYHAFARGDFASFLSGPWSLGELRHRLPQSLSGQWGVSPLPSSRGQGIGGSVMGGASLAISAQSKHKSEALELIDFLTDTPQQLALFHALGDLPSRTRVWKLDALQHDPHLTVFRQQLERALPLPKVPEWERIATLVAEHAERVVRGDAGPNEELSALKSEADAILAKRRWIDAARPWGRP